MKIYKMKKTLVLILLLLFCNSSDAFLVQLVKVKDGDTIVIRNNGMEIPCRLAFIDAPEMSQPQGQLSLEKLKELLISSNNELDIVQLGVEAFNRPLILIFNKMVLVNAEMVKLGQAEVYRDTKYHLLDLLFNKLEQDAKVNKVGIWNDPTYVSPKIWRKQK